MREELAILIEVTKEVAGDLPGGETVRYSGTYEPGRGFGSVHAVVTREDRQVFTIDHQRERQVGYNFSAGDDFETMETVIGEVLSDVGDLYDGAGSESAGFTIENGITTGVSDD